jgi:competence protein ComEC
MFKVLLFSIAFLIIVIRFLILPPLLPKNWKSDSMVRYSARLVREPQHTDTQTIVKSGHWTIVLRGYQDLILGKTYTFVGAVEPTIFFGRQTKVRMTNPSIAVSSDETPPLADRLMILLTRMRGRWESILAQRLPEPESTLASGILLGVNGQLPKDFQDKLAATGTMHIVAASGYNVMIVAQVIAVLLLRIFGRRGAVIGSVLGIWLYVVIAGGTASVVRAGIMGSLTLIAFFFGRPTQAKRILSVAIFLILMIDPRMIVDVGFQLSAAATLGLLYLEPWIKHMLQGMVPYKNLQAYLAEYLYPTLAATIATLPIILWTFGRVSWISPLSNILILPLVPLIMLLTALAVGTAWIPGVNMLAACLVYVPLRWMVFVIQWLG